MLGVIGLGYFGLPFVMTFSKRFRTVGFDVNETHSRRNTSLRSFIWVLASVVEIF